MMMVVTEQQSSHQQRNDHPSGETADCHDSFASWHWHRAAVSNIAPRSNDLPCRHRGAACYHRGLDNGHVHRPVPSGIAPLASNQIRSPNGVVFDRKYREHSRRYEYRVDVVAVAMVTVTVA